MQFAHYQRFYCQGAHGSAAAAVTTMASGHRTELTALIVRLDRLYLTDNTAGVAVVPVVHMVSAVLMVPAELMAKDLAEPDLDKVPDLGKQVSDKELDLAEPDLDRELELDLAEQVSDRELELDLDKLDLVKQPSHQVPVSAARALVRVS